jgi:LPXTG-site transpeptidase (sortase) family protein
MNPFDTVLKRARATFALPISKAVVVGATALVLTVTPSVSALAGPLHAPAAGHVSFQDDDNEQTIVTVGSSQDISTDDDSAADTQSDEDAQPPANDDDMAADNGAESQADDQPASDQRPDVNLQPAEWIVTITERLLAPFSVFTSATRITAPEIGLDAAVTPRQIVGGEMQTPKDENEVSWYRGTAAPGEAGNAVFAGHLNWYGVPQAVFYGINQLEKGDLITVTDDRGQTFTYRVQWVKLVDVADADFEKLVGPTKKSELTMITCGGDWNPAASEYDARTVVRAYLVKDQSA